MLSDYEDILRAPMGMRGCDSIENVICHAKRGVKHIGTVKTHDCHSYKHFDPIGHANRLS